MGTVLKRTVRPWPQRPACFVKLSDGMILETGEVKRWSGLAELETLLGLAQEYQVEVMYVVGGWSAESSPSTEWFQAPENWERVSYNRNPFVAVYKKSDGLRVTIHCTAQWFGSCDNASLCRKAYLRLRLLLRGVFDKDVTLMGTPARTGLDLIERSLKHDCVYEQVPDDVLEVVEHNIGQGRMEMLPILPNVPQTQRLYVIDAVWMYASCCRRLPALPLKAHDSEDTFAEYDPAFYRVKFRVPVGWAHIGLLPTWHPKQHRTVYPWKPGDYEYEGFVNSYELRLAREKGWDVRIEERWVFVDERSREADPLGTWVDKLRMLREKCTDERERELGPLLRAAIRAILIKAIGSMHRKGRYEQVETPVEEAESIPEGSEIIGRVGSSIRWKRAIPLHKSMMQFQHPEWSAYVWGIARHNLAKEALKHPREAVVALRSDALALAYDPGTEYEVVKKTSGVLGMMRPGMFRLKEVLELQGASLPTTNREYLDLRRANRLVDEGEEEDV